MGCWGFLNQSATTFDQRSDFFQASQAAGRPAPGFAHVFGVDVTPHPQGVAVAEPGLTAALSTPHQEIAAPVAHQGIGEVGSSSALGRSMKKPSGSIFCNRGASAGRTHTCFISSESITLVWAWLAPVMSCVFSTGARRAGLSCLTLHSLVSWEARVFL